MTRGLWENSSFCGIPCAVFRCVCRVAKSDYELLYACPSFLPHGTACLLLDRFLHMADCLGSSSTDNVKLCSL